MTSAFAIETRGLRKEFGPKVAVDDLTLTVERGEIFGFLGPNGAGKTTSIKMLIGLVAPTSGAARVLGAETKDVATRAKIGFLPEHFRFHDWLTAQEFLQFNARLYGMPRRSIQPRIDELLDRVDLLDARDRKLREYSKGMLQRVGLAQALINQPDLVFLDEPTSGLDPLGRLLVRDIMRDLSREGTTVFLNSHLLGEVEATCDRVAFVRRGRVVKELVIDDRASALTVEVRVDAVTPELVEQLSRVGFNPRHDDSTIWIDVEGEARVPELATIVVESGARLYKLVAGKPSLEETFLEVMGGEERPG